MTEINGFQIETFNQYGLEEGKKENICPKCSAGRKPQNQKKKVLLCDWERGLSKCQHCGVTLQLHTYTKRTTHKNYSKPTAPTSSELDSNVIEWFKTRGISRKTLEKAKVTTRPGWIDFNYYINDELINIKSRNAKKQFQLGKNCELIWYNFNALLHNDTIIVVEGEIDALSYMEAGYDNVVSVPNGATNFTFLDSSIDLFDNIDTVFLSVDSDEAGQKLQSELVRRIGAEKCFLANLFEKKDANELLMLHGVDTVLDSIDEAIPIPLDNVKTLKDYNDELDTAVREGFKKGKISGMDNFDNIFSIVDHQFCVVTGMPSSGKSDFVDMLCLGYNKKYNWPIGYASPENFPIHYHTHKLMRKTMGRQLRPDDIGTETYENTKTYVDDNFYFIELHKYTLENVLKKGAELVKRKGIKCLVIDPYNKIKLENGGNLSINDYTNEYLNQIDAFCKKYDCFVFIVAHPVKLRIRDDGTYPVPSMYDIKGGGEFADMCPNGIAVHRNYKDNTTTVKINKVKFQFQGENNAECEFTWDKGSGSFIPMEERTVIEKLGLPF